MIINFLSNSMAKYQFIGMYSLRDFTIHNLIMVTFKYTVSRIAFFSISEILSTQNLIIKIPNLQKEFLQNINPYVTRTSYGTKCI